MARQFLLHLVIFSFVSSSFANTKESIGFATRSTRWDQYHAYLKAHPSYISYARWKLDQLNDSQSTSELEDMFLEAKSAFFQQGEDQALSLYQKVLELRNLGVWRTNQQRLLFHSSLRAFELTASNSDKTSAIELAARIGYFLAPDGKVFAPPTLLALAEAKQQVTKITVPVTGWMKDYELLNYNGQTLSIHGKNQLQLIEGTYRFEFLSSKVASFSVVTETKNLIQQQHQAKPLVSANCEISAESMGDETSVKVIDGMQLCGQTLKQGSASRSESVRLSQLDLKPKPKTNHSGIDTTTSLKVEKPKQWWQNKWLWIGLASATTAYLIYDQNQRDQGGSRKKNNSGDDEPTVTFEQ